MDILELLKLCINTIAYAVLMPSQNFAYIVFIIIIYAQYKKNLRLQEYIYGLPKTPLKNLVLTSVLSGLVAGILVSIPMTLLGVTFNENMGIEYLLLISVCLMLIEPRFICFSYSGGVLALASLILGINSIDVAGVLVLVSILHLLESVLIYIDGYRGAVPVFFERKDGSVSGGFRMQRFWPIPIALILFAGYGIPDAGSVMTPNWWPLIKPPYIDISRLEQVLFILAPMSAILGYSEFTSSYLPREKCRESAYKLAIFSIVLFFLSLASSRVYIFKYIAALFAPLGHEFLIRWERRLERNRESIFAPSDRGIRVLDTIPKGPAEKMGIQPGETILSINNIDVNNDEELDDIFKRYLNYVWVDVKDRAGKVRTLEYNNYRSGVDGLDVLSVPSSTDGLVIVKEKKSFIRGIMDRFAKK